jgi:hypothetical protein
MDGAAETVTAGTARAAVVRDDGRRSGDRRARTVSTIRDGYGAGNLAVGEKRRNAGNRRVSRQLAASERRVMAMGLREQRSACDIASVFVLHVRDTTR